MLARPGTVDPATPLREVTFCVVDLETTGGSPATSAITEIGAVRYRGGELLGTYQTLVDPGVAIPRFITHLTGIDEVAVAQAPMIEAVLPSLMEFLDGGVFVAHNARFDFSFLNAALERAGYERLAPLPVCTAKLAKRVVWPDVPNVRLDTLAQYFRSPIRPTHRALPDAEACAEVLHGLLDLGAAWGSSRSVTSSDRSAPEADPTTRRFAWPTRSPTRRACTCSAARGAGSCTWASHGTSEPG
jgi:DNA polymerase-3 subunit epsilon